MRLSYLLCMVLVLAAGCVPITAPTETTPSTPTSAPETTLEITPETITETTTALVFANVRVFDGEEVLPTASVVVQDGLITAVGTDVEIPAGAEVIEGDGQTLLPGLIDAHNHVFSEDALRQALIFGVTTELDMFMDHSYAAYLRQQQAENGAVDRADVYSAGTLATAPNGHGTQFGLSIPTLTSPDEAEEFVNDRIEEGSDYIKIIIESGSESWMVTPSLDQATVDALVEAAHAQGMLTLVHVQTLEAAQQALAAGADGLAHIFSDAVPDESFIERAVESGLFVIPTLAVFQHIGSEPLDSSVIEDPHLSPYLTQADLQSLTSPYTGWVGMSLATGQEAVRLLFEAGVPILAGTDAQNPGTTHGASLHRELVLLTESGLSPLDALRSATSVTADIFSLPDRGRIAPGLRADLLLVNGDPTSEITATRDIAGVWKLGVRADREGYLANLEAERAATATQLEAFEESDIAVVSDFESETVSVNFGSDWEITTDQPAGGTSMAELQVVEDGAAGSNFSLRVTGEVSADVPFAWAGVMYMPGATPFAPFDLSSKPMLHFWAKGEGGPYRVQVFCEGVGQVPPEQPFEVTSEWQEFSFDLSTFDICDSTGVQAIILSAGPAPGAFALQIDEVSFQ